MLRSTWICTRQVRDSNGDNMLTLIIGVAIGIVLGKTVLS